MKYKTKSVEVEADKANNVNYYVDGIGFIEISQFDKLFEPAEEESEKHETFQCEECSNDFPLSVLYTDPDGLSLCKTCYDDCN